jgi:hypothetical protein
MPRSCGHHTTKSRHYSTTRTALKTARRHWHHTHTHHRSSTFTSTEHTQETTLTVTSLSFAGIGYRTTGDQWLALTAAAKAREQRQIAKEECSIAA